jgi:hypothetical protein
MISNFLTTDKIDENQLNEAVEIYHSAFEKK